MTTNFSRIYSEIKECSFKNHIRSFLVLSLSAFTLTAIAGPDDPTPPRPQGPGDIYNAAGTPCVTAHSTTRALFASYNGPLYQVKRESDGKTLDIGIVQPSKNDAGGYANAPAQDAFCANTHCRITKIYDQSGKGNDLQQGPPGTFKGPDKGGFDHLPFADMAPITLNGHKVYGVYIMPGMGLRNNNAKDVAINDEPEGIYYVVNGKHFDSGCCFDYGNSSTNSRAVGTGTMETTYYGTSTAWGSGNGNGPWIMADLEAGLFSGYNAKKNDVPSINWQFVSAFVDGGGGNRWDLRGGDAQQGPLTTFYDGVRPGTPNSKSYFPMNKKGGILLGNGGDNGNGSAGTFYEGIMTTGYPTMATTDAVQANIVAAKYNLPVLGMSRVTTFTPQSTQKLTITFTNTTGSIINGLKLSIAPRNGWKFAADNGTGTSKTFNQSIAMNEVVSETFTITSSNGTEAGFITAKAEWKNNAGFIQSENIQQDVRNVAAIKINEVRLSASGSTTNQFIELYNASSNTVDISNWSLINTKSEWASVKMGTIPSGTKMAPNSFYVLGLGASGLIAPANAGSNTINIQSIAGFEAGQEIKIGEEKHTIATVGTPAAAMTTLFIPVSTGPWLTIPGGATNIPVTSAAGITEGQKMGIDLGGNYEVVTVTKVGKAATQANLAIAAKAGESIIKITDNANISVGDELIINTGARKEIAKVKRIINVVTAPLRGAPAGMGGEVELIAPLKLNHMEGVDVSDRGTGISFTPATRFAHKSADAVQALGTGITLEKKLAKTYTTGTAIVSTQNTTAGYQGTEKPNQWYGLPLSTTAGSIALMDASGKILVDGIVYGSQQSNSSANGTIASPEIAILEGVQSQGGCIVVVPSAGRGLTANNDQSNKSVGRFPDGFDSDNNCTDFLIQDVITLTTASGIGSNNIKVGSVAGFIKGQKIVIGSGTQSENAVITNVGTAGGTTTAGPSVAGATTIAVRSLVGFVAGQTITVGTGTEMESVIVATLTPAPRRFGNAATNTNPATDSLTITTALKNAHAVGEAVSGTGITLSSPLTKSHDGGTPVSNNIPTPGMPNQYVRKQ